MKSESPAFKAANPGLFIAIECMRRVRRTNPTRQRGQIRPSPSAAIIMQVLATARPCDEPCGPTAQPAVARGNAPWGKKAAYNFSFSPNGANSRGSGSQSAPLGLEQHRCGERSQGRCPWLFQVGLSAHKRRGKAAAPCQRRATAGNAGANAGRGLFRGGYFAVSFSIRNFVIEPYFAS